MKELLAMFGGTVNNGFLTMSHNIVAWDVREGVAIRYDVVGGRETRVYRRIEEAEAFVERLMAAKYLERKSLEGVSSV